MNMKSKILHLFLAIAMLPLLCACGDVSRYGTDTAEELVAAWPDSTAVANLKQHYAQRIDSVWWPGGKAIIDKALMAGLPDNDTLQLAGRMLANGLATADQAAMTLVMALQSGTVTPEQASNQVSLMHHVSHVLDNDETGRAFDAAAEDRIDDLGLNEQMVIYARITTPAMLGRALAADRDKNAVEYDEIKQRIDCLRNIYSDEEMKQFMSTYQPE